MDEKNPVSPALTPEEWADFDGKTSGDIRVTHYLDDGRSGNEVAMLIPVDAKLAVAALCLHGQPFGFTWEDVDMLREEHDAHALGCMSTLGDPPCKFLALADRIQALLPPRKP